MVTVPVTAAFEHEGRTYRPGDGITVEPAVAAVLSFRGVVSLLEEYREQVEAPKPAPAPAPKAITAESKPTRAKRARRGSKAGTYRRRDMRADDDK